MQNYPGSQKQQKKSNLMKNYSMKDNRVKKYSLSNNYLNHFINYYQIFQFMFVVFVRY